jgi:hypothetical protein
VTSERRGPAPAQVRLVGEVASFQIEGRSWFAVQAADGAIVLGDHEGLVQSALPARG